MGGTPPYYPLPPGNWPYAHICVDGVWHHIPFAYSVFDVWPELLSGLQHRWTVTRPQASPAQTLIGKV